MTLAPAARAVSWRCGEEPVTVPVNGLSALVNDLRRLRRKLLMLGAPAKRAVDEQN
jgi:hypothetical protein